jgi:Glycosyl transferase family 2/Met-10+ like-protein
MATSAKLKATPAPAKAAAPARLPTWATISTMKEKPEIVMDFIAHHLLLGASQIIIYFDDPEDPAVEMVAPIPQVRAIRCDAAFVASRGRHPTGLPARQKVHARRAYAETTADWIIHIDADEFIAADRPIAEVLAGVDGTVLRLAPFEALATPRGGQGDRPEHFYRGSLPGGPRGKRLAEAAYGPFQDCLAHGMLSHLAGKFFVRTGVPGMALAVHGPFLDQARAAHVDTADLRILHFHGGVYETWRRHLDRRLSDDAGGTYSGRLANQGGQANNHSLLSTLQELHRTEGEAGLQRFFRAACTFGPEKRVLKQAGALTKANLWHQSKRAAVFGTDPGLLRNAGFDAQTAQFEADADWQGFTLRLAPDGNPLECRIARGEAVLAETSGLLQDLVRGRKVLFRDLAAGVGFFVLPVARSAAPASRIIAVEADEHRRRRLQRNIRMNALNRIETPAKPPAETKAAGYDLTVLHCRAEQLGTASPDLLILSQLPEAPEVLLADLAARGYVLLGRPDHLAILKREKTKG